MRSAINGWANDLSGAAKRAHDLAKAAIEIEFHAERNALLGSVFLLMKHFGLAKAELVRAIAMNPNDAKSHAAFVAALQLDPRSAPRFQVGLGTTLFLSKRYEEALVRLELLAALKPRDLFVHLVLVGTYGVLDRPIDVAKTVAKIRGLHPFVAVLAYRTALTLLAHGQQLADTLVALGLE